MAEAEIERRKRIGVVSAGGFDPLNPPPDMTFRQWCEALGEAGMKVDGKPFTLKNRQALHLIYDLVPTDPRDGFDLILVLQKGAQMGLTVWEVLADLYLAIRGASLTVAMYVPDSKLAPYKSEHRFMPVVRSIPAVHQKMIDGGHSGMRGEGNKLTRQLRDSRFLFLWTSGASMTESFPADVVSFDEVQNMQADDIDKVRERMSGSDVRFTLLLSTPKWPNEDINYWYEKGAQYQFLSRCPGCGVHSDLCDAFPSCIALDAATGVRQYRCPECGHVILNPQDGIWVPKYPERRTIIPGKSVKHSKCNSVADGSFDPRVISVHLSQILSPTITAEQMWWSWVSCTTGEQKQNFYNRKLGLPYADPSKIPVTMAMLDECAAEGRRLGIEWEKKGKNTFMGIDQMGAFNVVIVKKKLHDGRQAVIHIEAIYSEDPFQRCDELMEVYGVACCVVETLPNYNDAKRFAARHKGKVYLASYGDQTDMVVWGDQLTSVDRKTSEEERDRYTVRISQYKAMQTSLERVKNRLVLFPDPVGLEQQILEGGAYKRSAICRDMLFLHLTRVALVAERDPETNKWSAKVHKVGIDPHFAYANMLCDIAWARAYGSSLMVFADETILQSDHPLSSAPLPASILSRITVPDGLCGACMSYNDGLCEERMFRVRAEDYGCDMFVRRG